MRSRALAMIVAAGAGTGLFALPQGPASGLDVAGFARSVRPQDDLYRYVNGAWLRDTRLPPDRVSYGAFNEVADRTDDDLRSIVDQVSAKPERARRPAERQIADLYASAVNEDLLERLDASPIEPELGRIGAIVSPRDLAEEMGRLSAIGAGGPFAGTLGIDPVQPGAVVVRIEQGGILLPDRGYYTRDDATAVEIRRNYERYLTRILEMTARADPRSTAAAVLALEAALARIMETPEHGRDARTAASRLTLGQLQSQMPGFDWKAWAAPQGIDRLPAVILLQPAFFSAFAALVPRVPIATWQAWLAARYVTACAPYLSKAFGDARFDFFGRELTGQELPWPRWRRGIGMIDSFLGDALGRLYVESRFPAPTRARVSHVVGDLVEAYRQTVRSSDWLSAGAKRTTLDKLDAISTGVGYPAVWRSYDGLVVKPDDLFGNWQRALAFESRARLSNPGGSAGGGWALPPQTVNAYYTPSTNEIVVPAAILQPPIFDAGADDAANYGAVGALVGHEIAHAFDDRGRWFDAAGKARDWWTAVEEGRYRDCATRLADQLNAIEPLPGVHVNGALAAPETLADIAGLSIAFRAYERSLNGKAGAVIDGLTGERRVFMGWAQMWRAEERKEYVRSVIGTSAYLPPAVRANVVVSNVDAFYEAFDVKPGDRMYRAPRDRVNLWPMGDAPAARTSRSVAPRRAPSLRP